MKKKMIGVICVIVCMVSIKGCMFADKILANGIVTEIRRVQPNKHGNPTMDEPVVTFLYNGSFYKTRKDYGATFISFFEVGDPATVYFDSFYPEGAEIYTFIGYWFSFPTIVWH